VSKYLEKGDKLKAIELYRKANRATDAAQLLALMAEDLGKKQANPLRAKKLHVLAAFEVERFRKKVLDVTLTNTGQTIAQTTAQTLDNLMTVDRESGKSKVLDNAWRGAAAYHYYLLAHRQLYQGHVDAAMKTAIRLAEFEDILSARDVYSLIALAAYHNRHYGICSRAFIKLETLPPVAAHDNYPDAIQTLAVNIFTKNAPYDPAPIGQEYIRCLETGTPYHACVVTGRAVHDSRTYLCRTCRHFAIESELRVMKNCPLCHSPLL
jgi:WD repeat-containing protein 35